MPAGNVSIEAEFEALAPIASIDVAPTVATNVVVNKTAAAQTVAMAATVNAEEEATLTDDQKVVTWSTTGVEGVTIDPSTGVLSIPANTNTGTVTVTATSTVRDDKTGTATVRIDPELVSKSGRTTTIYVADDYISAKGTKQELPQDLKGGGKWTTLPDHAAPELTLNSAATGNNQWGIRSVLSFAIPESVANMTIYSITLKVPMGWGYQNASDSHNLIANDLTSAETMQCYSGKRSEGTFTVNFSTLIDAIKAKADDSYNVTLVPSGSAHGMSVLARESMVSGNRGAYLEIVEGYNITYKYVDGENQPVSGLAVTLSDEQTGTTNASGEVTFIVAGGTNYTATTEEGAYKTSTKTLENVNADVTAETVTLESNGAKDVTFSATNDENATVAVYTDEEKTEANKLTATSGNTYSLTQGVTYYYTITPAEANTNTYDPYNGSVTVAADTTTVSQTLGPKTYALKVSGVPGYAKIYTSEDGETYTANPVAYTNYLGQIVSSGDGTAAPTSVTATDVLNRSITGGTTVYYKITKNGYTDFTGNVTMSSEQTINAATMTPSTANVIYYEDLDWQNAATASTGSIMGSLTYRGDKGKLISWQDKGAVGNFNTDSLTATKYALSFTFTSATSSSKDNTYTFTDKNGKTLAQLVLHGANTDADKYYEIVVAGGTTFASTAGTKADTKVIKLTVDTAASSNNVTLAVGDTSVTGTVEGAGMIKSISTSGNVNYRLGTNAFTIETVE